MDALRFESFLRSLAEESTRRGVLRGVVVTALGASWGHPAFGARAKKRKRKLRFNAFGCVNVGGKCRGKDSVCCSGICKGKKPKKGEKDKSRCVAHDEGGCQAGPTSAGCGGTNVLCTTSTGQAGGCITTTGNAGYCGASIDCPSCTKDADCQARCGPQAACVLCPSAVACDANSDPIEGPSTRCVGPSSGACIPPP
jgi:hypothetical protein